MKENIQNIHPNILHAFRTKNSPYSSSYRSKQPQVSRFNSFSDEKDWKKKVLAPSELQQKIQQKLGLMLNNQKIVKEILPTNLSQDKATHSFMSSANVTLQKYFQDQRPNFSNKSKKQQLVKIVGLLHKLLGRRIELYQELSQQQLLQVIKQNLLNLTENNLQNDRTQ